MQEGLASRAFTSYTHFQKQPCSEAPGRRQFGATLACRPQGPLPLPPFLGPPVGVRGRGLPARGAVSRGSRLGCSERGLRATRCHAWGARKPLQVHVGAARVGGNRPCPAPPRELSLLTLRIAHLCHALRGRPGAARPRALGPLRPAFQALTTFGPAATCWGHAAYFSLGLSPRRRWRERSARLWNTHPAVFRGAAPRETQVLTAVGRRA